MARVNRWLVGGLIIALIPLSACSKAPVLGILLPISGDAATYGKSMSDAIHLALEQAKANDSLPPNFQAVWADSGSEPTQAIDEFKQLVDRSGAKIVIGGCKSDVASALIPTIKAERTICISPSASAPSLINKTKLLFRMFPSDDLEGTRAGDFLYKEQGRRKVLIFSSGNEHARGVEPEFRHEFEQNLGGKIVARILLTDPDWQRQATDALTSSQPDAVYIIAYAQPTVDVLKFLQQKHFNGTRCVTSAFYNRSVLDANRALVDGVYFPLPSFDADSKVKIVKDFVSAYRERYGVVPDIFAAHAYDAARVAVYVLKKAKYLQADELRKTIQFDLTDFQGVTGAIRFDDYGGVRHNPIMYIVKDGKVLNFERYRKQRLQTIRQQLLKELS